MPELVDLVDSKGSVQKRGVWRHEAGRYKHLYLPIVIVVVFDPLGRLLVQRRSMSKRVNKGDFDHICGAILSGETAWQAAVREALEEAAVRLTHLQFVEAKINPYNNYRHLFVAQTTDVPRVVRPHEVMEVGFRHLDELEAVRLIGKPGFVRGFFEDIALVLA